MKFLKNLKIGKKLTLGFVVMILFMMVIGLNSYRSVFQIENDIADMLEVDLAGVKNLLQAGRDLTQMLVAERSMIFANTSSDLFKSLVTDYEKSLKQFEERWIEYKALLKIPEEEQIIPKFEKARNEWRLLTQRVVEGRKADTRDGRREALDLTLGLAKQKFDEMQGHMDKLTEIVLHHTSGEKGESTALYLHCSR